MPTLTRIYLHPVKSLRGQPAQRVDVGERGLRHDREWVVVGDDGRALTQRDWPGMALVAVDVDGDELRLSIPDRAPLVVSRGAPLEAGPEARRRAVVWGDEVDGVDCGAQAGAWLSEALGTRCHLVRMDDASRRTTTARDGVARAVSFADELPLLLLSEASLDDLARRIPGRAAAERFRPNLVVSGCDAYAEDRWRRLRIGDVEIELVKPAGRCVLVTVDPATGERDAEGEPLRTLAGYRRAIPEAQDDEPRLVYLGVRGAATRLGSVSIGDDVEVLA